MHYSERNRRHTICVGNYSCFGLQHNISFVQPDSGFALSMRPQSWGTPRTKIALVNILWPILTRSVFQFNLKIFTTAARPFPSFVPCLTLCWDERNEARVSAPPLYFLFFFWIFQKPNTVKVDNWRERPLHSVYWVCRCIMERAHVALFSYDRTLQAKSISRCLQCGRNLTACIGKRT